MEVKTCTVCGIDKKVSEFAIKNRLKNKYSSDCKECHREIRRKYYINNREKERERLLKTKLRYRTECENIISEYKKECLKCGENHPAVLQFHHRENDTKEFDISHYKTKQIHPKRVLEEIKKCDVLCANCHFKHHYNERMAEI